MILKLTEFQDSGMNWHAVDISGIAKSSTDWLHLAAAANMTPSSFVEKLVNDFRPDNVYWNDRKGFLMFSWKSQAAMRKFKNWMNKQARDNKYHWDKSL